MHLPRYGLSLYHACGYPCPPLYRYLYHYLYRYMPHRRREAALLYQYPCYHQPDLSRKVCLFDGSLERATSYTPCPGCLTDG